VKRARRKIEETLWVTGLHAPARSVYRVTAGRKRAKVYGAMMEFYRELVPSGVLVFDIGANVGMLSEMFASLGARVVALEPNSDCVRHMELSYPENAIEVIQAVVGPQNGLATLNLSNDRDDISSLSDDWIAAIQGQHSEYRGLWSKKVTVPMVTLDTLLAHYGMPHFIKIDVEGYEESVLDGLSVQPAVISFEFNAAFLPAALRCLDRPVFESGSVFNFAMGDPSGFELDEWVGREQLKEVLTRIEKADKHGDIFVKSPKFQTSKA
jgi:FkbM family methyltransferase